MALVSPERCVHRDRKLSRWAARNVRASVAAADFRGRFCQAACSNLHSSGEVSQEAAPHHVSSRFVSFAFLLVLTFVLILAGCNKKTETSSIRLTPSQIHSITRELEAAAKSAAPAGSQIHGGVQISRHDQKSTDRLDITLFSGQQNDPEARSAIAKLQQSLNAVATRHGLTEQPAESREGVLFYYQSTGKTTHAIHIHIQSSSESEQNQSASNEDHAKPSGARLAIILDDLGNDRAAAKAIFALPYPLTVSVLPNHPHSTDIAEEAHRRGYEVMLHLPMKSIGKEQPEKQELSPGMQASEVTALVDQFLKNVPDVAGVNNHQGSEATSDSALMSVLMPALRDHRLYYVDSRTTAATVAYEAAQYAGVRSGFRNVPFLDDVENVSAIRKQLALALRGAHEKGEAIAIGHPHPETLEALREVLPQAQAEGVQLVFASNIVH